MTEDLDCLKQIQETNKLGNALLSGLIVENIEENKKNIKVSSNLKHLCELIESYRDEMLNLKSLRIGTISDILEIKENFEYQDQIETSEKLLQKVDEILKLHVKHNQAKFISREELNALCEQTWLINSIKDKLAKIPESNDDLNKRLVTVREIQRNLNQITSKIDTIRSKLENLQATASLESLDVIYYSI